MSLLAIDPGETVGWTKFVGNKKVAGGQMDWADFVRELTRALGVGVRGTEAQAAAERVLQVASLFYDVTEIVMEDFVIYPDDVGPGPPPPWDPVITARLIGKIELIAELAGVPVVYQGANIKSDALRSHAAVDFARPLYENRHENDATMHGTYLLARRLAKFVDGGPS